MGDGARTVSSDANAVPVDRTRTIAGIVTYLVLTFGLSAIIWRQLINAKTLSLGGGLWVLALMWCPGVSGLVTRLLFQRTLRGVGWRLGVGHGKYEWAGYWIPIAYASAIYLPLWALGYGTFQSDAVARLASRLHLSATSPVAVIGVILITATVGMIGSSIAALGEELGWRGFLVPELAKVTSFGWVGLISGAIWASWHMPLIIGADYHGANPVWYSILCFGLGVIALGYIFTWIRLKSGSVWPAMLLHASHNLFIQAIFDPRTRSTPFTNYTIGEFGAGFVIVAWIVVAIIWRDRGKERVAGNG